MLSLYHRCLINSGVLHKSKPGVNTGIVMKNNSVNNKEINIT